MLRWFPRFQVPTACFSCSPPDLNCLDPYFIFMYMHYNHWGKTMANYPQELAQDVVCQSHTGHMTGLWFLPARPLRLNTNE